MANKEAVMQQTAKAIKPCDFMDRPEWAFDRLTTTANISQAHRPFPIRLARL